MPKTAPKPQLTAITALYPWCWAAHRRLVELARVDMRVVDGVQRVQRSLTLDISTEAVITRVTILHDGRLRLARALFGLRS